MARLQHWPAFLRSPRFWVIGVVAVVGLALLYQQVDPKAVRATAAGLNGGVAFLLLLILPLMGFPVSVLHVAAGVRFGVLSGLGLVWLSILLQLLASFVLVRWQRRFFARRLKSVIARLPHGAHVPVTFFMMLVPGVPYFAKNYSLPLVGVPFRTYLGICLPVHAAHSCLAVLLGGQSHELTPGRVWMIAAYAAVLLATSWWALRRLRTALGDPPPAANGRKQSA